MEDAVKLLYRILLILSLVVYVVVAAFLPLIAYPLSIFSRKAPVNVGSFFAYWSWSIFSRIFRITTSVEFPAHAIKHGESYLIISNHVGSVDFMVMNELAITQGMLSCLKYLIKQAVIYVPVFGIGMKVAGFLYIKRDISHDRQRIINYCKFMKETRLPIWLILYPEGTRFREEKRAASQEFSRNRGLPVLKNVLTPRTQGFKLLAQSFKGSHIKNVVDMTIFFDSPDTKVPSLLDVLIGKVNGSFKVDIEVTPLEDISNFDAFVRDSFVRKDKKIEAWKRASATEHT